MDALGQLAAALETRKLIFLSRRAGLRPRDADTHLSIINLTTDYDTLVRTHALPPKQAYLLAHARRLLDERVAHRMLIAVTSPLQLLRELFTIKGAGTLIKRGSTVLVHQGLGGIDCARLGALVGSSFGRALRDDFFARTPISKVYLEERYRGAALLTATPLGGYLCKFAVERQAQGEGIGRDIWQLLIRDHPTLFWRARPQNPIASWYHQECDGLARFADWHVFWRGLTTERIPDVIEYALAQPVDFAD
jgi:acetylglutamate kinase